MSDRIDYWRRKTLRTVASEILCEWVEDHETLTKERDSLKEKLEVTCEALEYYASLTDGEYIEDIALDARVSLEKVKGKDE